MTTASIQPPATIGHVTILVFSGASNTFYGLTTHRDGEQIQCAISRRICLTEPSPTLFDQAAAYIKSELLPNRKHEAIALIDHAFELNAAHEILHSFDFLLVNAAGESSRHSMDLKAHVLWVARVQPAIRLLLRLGA